MDQSKLTAHSFEKIDSTNSAKADAAYLLAGITLTLGIVMFWLGTTRGFMVGGIALVAIGFLAYIHLFRRAEKVRYFPYLWLDQTGVHHIQGNGPTDRIAHFTWQEIERAEIAPPGGDVKALILFLNRSGMRGVPVYLTTEHATEAAAAIQALKLPVPSVEERADKELQ
jgi:hypothetical protein